MMLKLFKSSSYDCPDSCGPLALRQLCDKSDHEIMSACCLHGYKPGGGGMNMGQFIGAARTLGIKLGKFRSPKPDDDCIPIAEVAMLSKLSRSTVVCGVDNHVLVVKEGEVLDQARTHPGTPVECLAFVGGDDERAF